MRESVRDSRGVCLSKYDLDVFDSFLPAAKPTGHRTVRVVVVVVVVGGGGGLL